MKKYKEMERQRKKESEEEQRRLQRERKIMEMEIRRSNSRKMYNLLNTFLVINQKKVMKSAFGTIHSYATNCDIKIKKHHYSMNFQLKVKFFKAWASYAHKRAQERLFEQYKQEKIKEKVNMERAAHHFKVNTQKKCFDLLNKEYLLLKEERKIQREHEAKLQTFMENMNKKAEEKRRQQEYEIEMQLKQQQEMIERKNVPQHFEPQPLNIEAEEMGAQIDTYELSKKVPESPELNQDLHNMNLTEESKVVNEFEVSLTPERLETQQDLSKITEDAEESQMSQIIQHPQINEIVPTQTVREQQETAERLSSPTRIPNRAPRPQRSAQKPNPIMNKMESRAQERQRRRLEIQKKKQEQKEAEDLARKEEAKAKKLEQIKKKKEEAKQFKLKRQHEEEKRKKMEERRKFNAENLKKAKQFYERNLVKRAFTQG